MRKIDLYKYVQRNGTSNLNIRNREIHGPCIAILKDWVFITSNVMTCTDVLPIWSSVPIIYLDHTIIDHCKTVDVLFIQPLDGKARRRRK